MEIPQHWWLSTNYGLDVACLYSKNNMHIGETPMMLEFDLMRERIDFIQEEVNELRIGNNNGDILEMVDALVDVVYVVLGTAIMMGIDFNAHWKTVHEANMSKVRGVKPSRGHAVDLVKPEGWRPPDHALVLDNTGYQSNLQFSYSLGVHVK